MAKFYDSSFGSNSAASGFNWHSGSIATNNFDFVDAGYNADNIPSDALKIAKGGIIEWKDSTSVLDVEYHYKVRQTTTGTSHKTGSLWLVWYDNSNSAWETKLVSSSDTSAGVGNNTPQIAVNGSNQMVSWNHYISQNFTHYYSVEAIGLLDQDGTLYNMGSDFQWQRDGNTLSYGDGDVSVTGELQGGSLDIDGDAAISGGLTVGGNTILGNALTDKTIVHGHLGIGDDSYPKIAYPGENALWGAANNSTVGQVVIDLPGTLSNYDMTYMEIDIYEYNSTNATKLIIGGHNWNAGGNSDTSALMWHNVGVTVIGSNTKSVYLGWRNDGTNNRRCIAIGETDSTWGYPTIHVAKVHGNEGYSTGIDWVTDWGMSLTTSSSFFSKSPTTNWNATTATTFRTTGKASILGEVEGGSLDINGNADISGNLVIAGTVDGVDISTLPTSFAPTDATATNTANVTAAGALMDSEVDANIQTLALPASTTISAFGASLVDDTDAATARATLGLGTAAITASTAYATAAQGTLATNALPNSTTTISGSQASAITNNTAKPTLIDEDNMASDSDTQAPSQQSVKAYVDSKEITSLASFVYVITGISNATPSSNGELHTNNGSWATVTAIKIYNNDAAAVDRSSFFDQLTDSSNHPSTLKFPSNNGGVVTCTITACVDNTTYYTLTVSCTTTGGSSVVTGVGLASFVVGVVGIPGADGTDGTNGTDGGDGSDGAPAGFGAITATTGAIGVTAGGTNAAQTLAFSIPAGEAGAAAGFGSITASTGAIGVTSGGTNAAQTLAFTIPSGTDGTDGQDGAPAGFGAITASTGAIGVTSGGTNAAQTLAFSIPSGEAGEDGSDGAPAGFGAITASTGAIGVTSGGTNAAQTLAFTIPSGTNGSNGAAAGFGTASASGIAAGSTPTVVVSGPDTAKVFEFGIPAGVNGTDGTDATVTFASTAEVEDGTDTTKVISPDTLRDSYFSRSFKMSPTATSNASDRGQGDIVYWGSVPNGTSTVPGTIYYLSSLGQWTLTNSGNPNSAAARGLLGVALGTAVSDGILLRGIVKLVDVYSSGESIGATLFLHSTAGQATDEAPITSTHTARIIGYLTSSSSDTAWFNPDNTFVEID